MGKVRWVVSEVLHHPWTFFLLALVLLDLINLLFT